MGGTWELVQNKGDTEGITKARLLKKGVLGLRGSLCGFLFGVKQ